MVRHMIYVFNFEKKSSYLFNMFFSLFHSISGENMCIFPRKARGWMDVFFGDGMTEKGGL